MLDTAQHLLTDPDLLGIFAMPWLHSSVISSLNLHPSLDLHSQMLDLQQSIHTSLHSNLQMNLLAQQTKQFNQDVMGDIGKGWDNFVKSGQLAAMAIGLVVGYMFRSITNR